MRICETVALDPHLSLRICLDFIFKSASTLTRRVKGTLTPVISLTHRVKGRTLSTSLQVGIYSNPQRPAIQKTTTNSGNDDRPTQDMITDYDIGNDHRLRR